MIAFVSLFLGLVMGPQAVEVAVEPSVARVEIRLGERVIGKLVAPPWKIFCDLGRDLAPRVLSAVAFDREGREVGVARQWLNLPRQPAEVSLMLERAEGGGVRAVRLAWESIAGGRPRAVAVTLDGAALPIDDPARLELPPHDPDQLHFLRATVDFPENVTSVAEVAFGGLYGDQVATELTGVPVELAPGAELPAPAGLAGWFLSPGGPLDVVAVDEGVSEAVVVRDQGAVADLDRLGPHLRFLLRGRRLATGRPASLRHALALSPDQRVRLLWPVAERRQGAATQFAVFPTTAEYAPEDSGLYWLLLRLQPPREARSPQRLTEAVAVAGLSAAARARRRAVVLVLGPEPEDRGQLDPATVRSYLRDVRVPLHVWATREEPPAAAAAWGPVRSLSDPAAFEAAVKELAGQLDRQRIVWVRGKHLPQEIALSPLAAGIRLVE